MAILEDATLSKTFVDGFRERYRSRMGKDAAIPAIPVHRIPAGVGAYLWGVAMGIAAALNSRPVGETPSK